MTLMFSVMKGTAMNACPGKVLHTKTKEKKKEKRENGMRLTHKAAERFKSGFLLSCQKQLL